MDFTGKTKAELRALKIALQEQIRSLGGTLNAKAEKARVTTEELKPFTDNILAAKEAYESKGFIVEIKTSKSGLITKWALKRTKSNDAEKTMSVDEFRKVIVRLGDKEFSSKDILNALIGSGIGARKLQPTLGNILKGLYGEPLIEKANEDTRGPGVRYRKVK